LAKLDRALRRDRTNRYLAKASFHHPRESERALLFERFQAWVADHLHTDQLHSPKQQAACRRVYSFFVGDDKTYERYEAADENFNPGRSLRV
jgi:hypothetical protein